MINRNDTEVLVKRKADKKLNSDLNDCYHEMRHF